MLMLLTWLKPQQTEIQNHISQRTLSNFQNLRFNTMAVELNLDCMYMAMNLLGCLRLIADNTLRLELQREHWDCISPWLSSRTDGAPSRQCIC